MNKFHSRLFGGLCAIAVLSLGVVPVRAQTAEVKEKPPMYTYIGYWDIPRAHWGDMEKFNAGSQKQMDQAVAAGTLVGYGDDTNLVHQPEGASHDGWWSALSMAGVMDTLESLSKGPPPPVLLAATKHTDGIFVSRYYNWHAGTYKGAYTHTAQYKLKADAPDGAVDSMCKSFIVPMMEKLLAEGAIVEYEIDEEAIHTESPDNFWVDYITATPSGIDKVNAALAATMKASPLSGQAIGSMIDFSVHRDFLTHTNAVYK